MSAKFEFGRFVTEAEKVHGKKFTYHDSSWAGIKAKTRITCPVHGDFDQVPRSHLNGFGCKRCSGRYGYGFTDFISEAATVHPGKGYTYIETSWTAVKNKITVICPLHGRFDQQAFDHLRGFGCQKCGSTKSAAGRRKSSEKFIKQAIEVHGTRYDYSICEYTRNKEAVTIICEVHGPFQQFPAEHLAGSGCQRCAGKHQRMHYSEFLDTARIIHADKYTYPVSVKSPIRLTDAITIECGKHGPFKTTFSRHIIRKSGCKHCSGTGLRTTEQFLTTARERFGDKYDYSLVEYKSCKTPVSIKCLSHGIFIQTPADHLNSAVGCPHCTYSVSRPETAWLDSLGIPMSYRQARLKIGGINRCVDAFDPTTNTVYEFWGDWWHGNPDRFHADGMHPKAKKTYGRLYQNTLDKIDAIKAAGYHLNSIWEMEWERLTATHSRSDSGDLD